MLYTALKTWQLSCFCITTVLNISFQCIFSLCYKIVIFVSISKVQKTRRMYTMHTKSCTNNDRHGCRNESLK
ncbi:hypothetical protein BD560DRAFT_402110 [Blakeslea trispora]|nr:hypothetical protein BD560DRAFT_402110 [Blakeslea trispora]